MDSIQLSEKSWDLDSQEAFKALRTNIEFSYIDKKLTTLTITSCSPNEGKSTVSYYLGATIAQNGSRVLLVDADLRKPMLMKKINVDNPKGLSNFILNRVKLEQVIHQSPYENLFYISCGVKPPNPTELLGSIRFNEFLETVSQQFDTVILDTPPLGNVIDAAIIASKTDATIMVIQPEKINFKLARAVKEQLENADTKILGVILNKMNYKYMNKRYYNYCHQYYGHDGKTYRNWLRERKQTKRKNHYD